MSRRNVPIPVTYAIDSNDRSQNVTMLGAWYLMVIARLVDRKKKYQLLERSSGFPTTKDANADF